MPPAIRRATPADAAGIARTHLASWLAHYRGLLPDELLDGLDPAAWEARRRGHLENVAPGIVNWVLEDAAGSIVGWCAVGPPRDQDLRPGEVLELYALYLDPAAVGRGLGRALGDHAFAYAAGLGVSELTLWVLRDNARARRYYRAAGFVDDPRVVPTDFHGAPSVRMVRAVTSDDLAASPPGR